MARLDPLDPPYDAEVADALRRLMGRADVEPLKLFRTIAHHPALLDRFRQIGSTVLSFGLLPDAEREVLIQRTTARCGAAYEWGVHAVAFAQPWSERTWDGAPSDLGDERIATLARLADELHDTATVSDGLWAELRAGWSDAELVEAVCLCGFYPLVSFACRAFAVDAEEWAATPPGPSV